ncbi:MAG: leucine-rich repeat domain-containing protein, partial [bacterium]
MNSVNCFEFDSDIGAIISSSISHIEIPSKINGVSVKSIGNGAFEGYTSLTSISLPKGVKEIGANAFRGCTSLTSISLPKGVKEIGERAFEGCTSLTSISLPEGVKEI